MHKITLLMAFGLVFGSANAVTAGQITDLQLYDGTSGSPIATIDYTGASGTGSYTATVYADPQVSFGTTNPLFYCVDLWHDNNIGSTYQITQVSSMAFAQSTFGDVDNRIGWLLTQAQNTADERAAVQLAIWYTVDNKPDRALDGFSMSTSNATVRNDYDRLISFAGYNAKTDYAAEYWQATHDASNTLYQNLVCAPPPPTHVGQGSVPEPSSVVLGFISVLSLGVFSWWRRLA